jgi:hypothetical protein
LGHQTPRRAFKRYGSTVNSTAVQPHLGRADAPLDDLPGALGDKRLDGRVGELEHDVFVVDGDGSGVGGVGGGGARGDGGGAPRRRADSGGTATVAAGLGGGGHGGGGVARGGGHSLGLHRVLQVAGAQKSDEVTKDLIDT